MNRAELSLLGILVNDVFWVRDPAPLIDAMDIARREYFSCELGKVVYSSLIKILQVDAVPDVQLIDELLTNNIDYNNNHGHSVISEAAKDAKTAVNVIKYANKVREEYFLRDAIGRIEEAKQELLSGGDAKDKINNALSLVGGISTDYDNGKNDCSFEGAINGMINHLSEVSEAGSHITGVDTGYIRLNELTHGLQAGNTIVVAGVPGGGKTTFCLNIMAHAAFSCNKKVLFYSLEMPKHEICMKLCSMETGITMQSFQSANVVSCDTKNKLLMGAIDRLKKHTFVIDDDASLTAEAIDNRTKRHAMEMGGIDLICVDYLTLLEAQGESETVRAGNAAKALKRLSKKFNCPVIIISQLVKNLNGRPTKSDLRQTGQLAQDASLIMFLYKDDMQIIQDGQSKLIELIVDKNRMGEIRDITLEPHFATNKMIETDRAIMYPIDSQGNEIKNKRVINRV